MPIFGPSKADLLRNQAVDAGWYKCSILKGVTKLASTDKSPNLVITFLLEDPEGKEIEKSFSSKALGFTQGMVEAILGRNINPHTENYRFVCPEDRPGILSLQLVGGKDDGAEVQLNGQRLQVKFECNIWQGRITNNPVAYASYSADLTPPF